MKYVLPGKLKGDGIRGDYLISVEQVVSSLSLRRLK